ncbi:23S rRNA (cytidine(2498)-2'-O)-methyltransferase RlmM [Azoarcus communis]|uniref:Ribosomal RNA large subunit methyltransferase M n=1 Tax=Parazoarcus communis SWub3 = DSM 12120 TaxID=1121029 RepID=A0A323V014_9RHOO|nr:23S rRNA (cytidine(2498)-2'-O)-methyltransferase RlmM [Parazoarcus communis]NMG48031.1 23S rRNA (cytidine(2498)-2'-O)-methyltransferase RlmM [Parazoarcus communis]NMG69774.1 23S rRNA (cytidine(2498)-2'-O)-methyltransferase RlmM [Parazoarcus communis SWub3 = DSM 12120]PZA18067.1 23S rRNA (cytidine(2498)-2'-O)-methyltransferase RlmM [Azoarcus communis] [Parazoarcus communis SWub3 = DSM 12120]
MSDANPNSSLAVSGLLAYCRAGFEKELAAELDDIAADAGLIGFVRTEPNTGFAVFESFEPVPVSSLGEHTDWRKPVFARQLLPWFARVDDLPERDRATPIVEAVKATGQRFSGVVLETPDTDVAKQQSGFCKRFTEPLSKALEKAGRLRSSRTGLPQLHVLFTSPTTVWLASGLAGQCAPWPMGIPRLRMPSNAPSRSTLKLAEALMTLLSDQEREELMRAGQRAVDLGAAPGGWTWQLANRGLRVTAVDNGPLRDSVMATEMVEHVRADGFTWRPQRAVDWMVCDMVEQPSRIASLMAEWVATGKCRHTIFNLKLPMKRRLDAVEQCRILIQKRLASIGPYDLRIKQLYHDREEVTAYLALKR